MFNMTSLIYRLFVSLMKILKTLQIVVVHWPEVDCSFKYNQQTQTFCSTQVFMEYQFLPLKCTGIVSLVLSDQVLVIHCRHWCVCRLLSISAYFLRYNGRQVLFFTTRWATIIEWKWLLVAYVFDVLFTHDVHYVGVVGPE